MHREGNNININDLCASFEDAVTDVLVQNTIKAMKELKLNKVAIAGGVSANSFLRNRMESVGKEHNFKVYYPELILCTDNAAMIASAAYFNYCAGKRSPWDLNAVPNLKIGEG